MKKFLSKAKLIESIIRQYPHINYDIANDYAIQNFRISFTKQQFSQIRKKLSLPHGHSEQLEIQCYREICELVKATDMTLIYRLLEFEKKYGRTVFFEQLNKLNKFCETR